MSDQNGTERDGEGSRIATNRTAVAIAVGSLVVAAVTALLARRGLLDPVLEFFVMYGVAVDTLPIYLLFVVLLVWLVVWSWGRLLAILQ